MSHSSLDDGQGLAQGQIVSIFDQKVLGLDDVQTVDLVSGSNFLDR